MSGVGDMKKLKLTDLLIFILLTELVGVISGLLAGNSFEVYSEITKPILSPPAGIFPVVWFLLYALMGTSMYIVYNCDKNLILLYAVQLFVNFMWSILFFRFRLIGISVIVILILIILVIIMTVKFFKINKAAGYINIPYIVWLIFAFYLNIGVYILN